MYVCTLFLRLLSISILQKWMKFICISFVLVLIAESVEYILVGPFDIVNIIGLIVSYFSFICLMIGMFAWRRFYKLLNIYFFYTAIRISIELGFLGELTIATIIATNKKSDPVRGQFFEGRFYFL